MLHRRYIGLQQTKNRFYSKEVKTIIVYIKMNDKIIYLNPNTEGFYQLTEAEQRLLCFCAYCLDKNDDVSLKAYKKLFQLKQEDLVKQCNYLRHKGFINYNGHRFFEYIIRMQTYILLRCLKQLGHLGLRKPHGLAFKADIYFGAAVLGLIDHDIALIIFGDKILFVSHCPLLMSIIKNDIVFFAKRRKFPLHDVIRVSYAVLPLIDGGIGHSQFLCKIRLT